MNASIAQPVIWIMIGMILMGLIVWFTMPFLMLIKNRSKLNYIETVNAITGNLTKKKDWQVKLVNDYQKSTESFAKIERVGSITICNPRLASKILSEEKNRGVTGIMPLAIGVYEDRKGQVFVSKLNVGLLGKMFGGTISEVMGAAGKEINEIVDPVYMK